jgi:multidrug efflux system membrane fusion protein
MAGIPVSPPFVRACASARALRPARALPGLALVLVALSAASGCGGSRARSSRVPVTVATVERRAMPLEITASGTVEPIEEAGIAAQVGGVVTRIHFREGQEVTEGQPLVSLDPRPFQAEYDRARGALGRDRAQWEAARLEAERARTLFEQGLLSSAEWEQKRAAAEALRAAVIADSGAAEGARLDLQFATIRAPISGRTGALGIHVGDLVRAGGEPLVTIVRHHPIRVRFTLPESDLPLLQRHRARGARVLARPTGDDSTFIDGRLVFVDNAVDAATGTLLLKGEFDNRGGRLWPGQFAEVRLVLATEPDRIVMPAPAVTTGQQGTYVYVLNRDSTVSSRPVTVARTQGDQAIVSSGVEPGEVVITDGQFRLAPGARVLVRRAPQGGTP